MALLIADTCQVLILLLGTIVHALPRLTSALKTLITATLSAGLDLPWMQMSLVTGFCLLNMKQKYSHCYGLNDAHPKFSC